MKKRSEACKHCVLVVGRRTHKQTNTQTDRGDYNTLRSSVRTVISVVYVRSVSPDESLANLLQPDAEARRGHLLADSAQLRQLLHSDDAQYGS